MQQRIIRYLTTLLIIASVSNVAFAFQQVKFKNTEQHEANKNYILQINKQRNQGNYDSALFYCEQLIIYANQVNSANWLIRANYRKIITHQQFGAYDAAFRTALLTEKEYCVERVSNNICGACNLVYRKVSEFMMFTESYEESLRHLNLTCNKQNVPKYFYRKAKLYIALNKTDSALLISNNYVEDRIAAKDTFNLILAYNQLGLIAKQLKKYDRAIIAFNHAIDLIDQSGKKETLRPILLGNAGSCYMEINELHIAYDYLLQDSKGSLTINEIISHISAEIPLADIEKKWGQYPKAIFRLEALLTDFKEELNQEKNQTLTYEIVNSLISIFKITNQHKEHLFYTSKLLDFNIYFNKINNKKYQNLLSEHSNILLNQVTKQLKIENELTNQKMIALKREDEKKQLRNWLLLSVSTLSFVVLLFFFWKYRSVQVKKSIIRNNQLELAKKEQELLELRVKEEGKNVQMLSLELIAKKDFSGLLLNKLKDFDNISPSDLKSIDFFVQNELELKSTRARLHNDISKVGGNFFNVIQREHQNLTELDLKLAAMVLMKLSNKEIAISRNVTTESIKTAKNRLKKKLNLSGKESLLEYLNKFF